MSRSRINPRLPLLGAVAAGVAACVLVVVAAAPSEDLALLLKLAGEAVVRQARESVVILGDERCLQRAFEERRFDSIGPGAVAGGGGHSRKAERRWTAELALIQVDTRGVPAVPWIEVRDVTEVDGKALPDREGRLAALFQPGQPMTSERLRAIVQENARYNIGPVQRTVNAPTIPLLVLHPTNQRRFVFSLAGEKKLDGIKTVRVSFRETMSPTLVRSADAAADMPSAGTLWIERTTGDVHRAEMHCGYSGETRLTVSYWRHPQFRLMVPRQLEESAYGQGKNWVEGRCQYSNFRRFETGARLLPPKAPDDLPW